jgi:hypothetical protein
MPTAAMELLAPTERLVLLLLKALLVRVEGRYARGATEGMGPLRSAPPSAAVVFTPPVRLEDLALVSVHYGECWSRAARGWAILLILPTPLI